VVANLKGPVSKALAAADVPAVLNRHGGHLCIEMTQALNIVGGADYGARRNSGFSDLVRRVDTANRVLQANTPSTWNKLCNAPYCKTDPERPVAPRSPSAKILGMMSPPSPK